ncbi:MAG: hypothetical protein NTX76_06195 [Alphaproteobacteria bacterium]|nr:hypothetical protein [Alphaproteobacteria bacterium]
MIHYDDFYFGSDAACQVLFANEVFETGQFFPKDFYFGNGDFHIFQKYLAIFPFLYFFKPGYVLYTLAEFVATFFFLHSIWLLTSLTEASARKRLIFIAFICSCISAPLRDSLFGLGIYSAYVSVMFYMMYYNYLYMVCEQSSKTLMKLCFLFLISFISNPKRAFFYNVIPVTCASFFYCYVLQNIKKDIALRCLKILTMVAAVGSGLYFYFLHKVYMVGTVEFFPLNSLRVILNNILDLRFYGQYIYDVPCFLLSIIGIISFYIVCINSLFHRKDNGLFYILLCSVVSFLSSLSFLVLKLPADIARTSFRYLDISFVLLLVIFFFSPRKKAFLKLAYYIAMACFILNFYMFAQITKNYDAVIDRSKQNVLSDFLSKNDLKYGYGAYENANAVTALSNNDVKLRSILFYSNRIIPFRWLSSERWYRQDAWVGKTFLALTAEKAHVIDWNILEKYIGKPEKELECGQFKIFIFPENIAKYLPGWDMTYLNKASFLASKDKNHTAGTYVETYRDLGPAIVAQPKEIGYLHFGPYVDVEPGEYEIEFDILADSHDAQDVLKIDVVTNASTPLKEESMKECNGIKRLRVKLDQRMTLEFRVYSLGLVPVVFKSVSIQNVKGLNKKEQTLP